MTPPYLIHTVMAFECVCTKAQERFDFVQSKLSLFI